MVGGGLEPDPEPLPEPELDPEDPDEDPLFAFDVPVPELLELEPLSEAVDDGEVAEAPAPTDEFEPPPQPDSNSATAAKPQIALNDRMGRPLPGLIARRHALPQRTSKLKPLAAAEWKWSKGYARKQKIVPNQMVAWLSEAIER